jgi:hypothetical protein
VIYNEYGAVKNDDDAVIGQLVGDGVDLSITNEEVLQHFTLCLQTRSDIPQDTNTFPIKDFAIRYYINTCHKTYEIVLGNLYCRWLKGRLVTV